MKYKKKGLSLIEILIIVAILGILAAIGNVYYGNYLIKAKKTSYLLNVSNLKKTLLNEFLKCELDTSSNVFNSFECTSNNRPSLQLIKNYVVEIQQLKNVYTNDINFFSEDPCILGSVKLSLKDKGSYSLEYMDESYYIINYTIDTIWTPSKTVWNEISTGKKVCWKKIDTGKKTNWKSIF